MELLSLQAAARLREVGKNVRDSLITYVIDRLGHDMRYAIDSCKLQRDLG